MATPHAAVLVQALDHLAAKDWDAAHRLVQDLEDPLAYWIHALVHRVEGDLSNARYWYHRAATTFDPARAVDDEIEEIRQQVRA